jgi:CheY-like chemotaxis protein
MSFKTMKELYETVMSQGYILVILFVIVILIAIFVILLAMGSRRKAIKIDMRGGGDHSAGIGEYLSTLSEVVFSSSFNRSISAVAASISRRFKASTFIFRRISPSIAEQDSMVASLIASSAENLEKVAAELSKAGLRLNVNSIPLQRVRAKLFELPFGEFDNPFQIVGDLITAAACKKLQHDLRFDSICTASVKTESGDFLILLLLPKRDGSSTGLQRSLEQYGALLKIAVYLSTLKTKLSEFENRFDERVVKLKNELQKKESVHLLLFHDMPMPAAVIDENGIITEASEQMELLFSAHQAADISGTSGREMEAVGRPLSSIMAEEDKQKFIESLLDLQTSGTKELNVRIRIPSMGNALTGPTDEAHVLEKFFVLMLVSRRDDKSSVVYFIDKTAEENLKHEFERVIDTLRTQNEYVENLLALEKRRSSEIVRNSTMPMLMASEEKILIASESAKKVFRVYDEQPLAEFISLNEISTMSPSHSGTISEGFLEQSYEATASGGRTFMVSQWQSEFGSTKDSELTNSIWFYTFNDITSLRESEAELRRITNESTRLFNSLLPIARVKTTSPSGVAKFVEWNDIFGSLFKPLLEFDSTFDSFLRYLGESPEACKSELHARGIIMRNCRTADRKFLNMSAAIVGDPIRGTEDSILVFVEDITEQENIRIQLHSLQSTFRNALESFSDEPIFVVENGNVSASNLAARNKLGVMLDEPLSSDVTKKISDKGTGGVIELDGKFYKIENTIFGNSSVYHFRKASDEVAQLAEIGILKKKQELLVKLAEAERYEDILAVIREILNNEGAESVKTVATGVIQGDKESSDVYLMTMSSGKAESLLSLSLSPADISLAERGGSFSRLEFADTTFANVISAGGSVLLIESTRVGSVRGFASMSVAEVEKERLEELKRLLKAASSVAIGIRTRLSVERKFEESGKVTRALIGLTGIDSDSFADTLKKTVDLLRQVFNAAAVGVYSVDGASMNCLAANGSLPNALSVPNLKFGMFAQASQLEIGDQKSTEGTYFALKSKMSKATIPNSGLVLLFIFAIDSAGANALPPSISELGAVSSIALDLLESRRMIESQSESVAHLEEKSKFERNFMKEIAEASTLQDILKILGESLTQADREAKVDVKSEGEAQGLPGEIVQKQEGNFVIYEANLINHGIGIVSVKCPPDQFTRTMVYLAIDKMKSLVSRKVPELQREATDLSAKLERAKESYSKLRDSVGRIPSSLRNARIGIDSVLSRLSFVQGDERVLQEIRLNLATAVKELSIDLESPFRNQDDIFEAVRVSIIQAIQNTANEGTSLKISNFDVSELTEFRVDQTTSELIKDLFVNFVIASGVRECEILMMTAQPSPNEIAEGKGKHISLRIASNQGEILRDDELRESVSIRTLIGKLEKMGYHVDTRALGNEMTMDICEIKAVQSSGEKTLSALLVEDDKVIAYEETQKLVKIFSRVKVASDAVEAAMIIDSERFDIAFVDLSLPSINGKELCRQIKSAHPECTTVLLTNREGEEPSEGVDHVMLRPLDEDIVWNYLRQ